MDRHFPHINSVTVSGEIVSAPRMRTSQTGSVSMTFVMQIEDMRERRTGRARLTVVVFDELARGAQGVLARGSEVLVEGALAPAGLKATGARLRATRIQARGAEGKSILIASSTEANSVEGAPPGAEPPKGDVITKITEVPEAREIPEVLKSESSEPGRESSTSSAGGRKSPTRKRSRSTRAPRTDRPDRAKQRATSSERPKRPSPATAKRERKKTESTSKKDESPFAFDEKEETFDPFLIGEDEK